MDPESRVVLNIDSRNDGRNSIMIDSLLKSMRENGYYEAEEEISQYRVQE